MSLKATPRALRCAWAAIAGASALILPFAVVAPAWGQDARLAVGPGRALVERHCTQCHATSRIAKAGGTEQGWADRCRRMIRKGSTLPRDQIPVLAAYLAKAYPVRLKPQYVAAQAPAGPARRRP